SEEREKQLVREELRAQSRTGLLVTAVVFGIANAICLLVSEGRWFYWVLVPTALILFAAWMSVKTGPTERQMARGLRRQRRRLRRQRRREQIAATVNTFEALVDEGAKRLLRHLDQRRRLGP